MTEWISVKERLPENTDDVLLWAYDEPRCGHYRIEPAAFVVYGDHMLGQHVTHWAVITDPRATPPTTPTTPTTPASAARDALVAACVAEENAILDVNAYNGKELADLYTLRDIRNAATSARVGATRAYIAALAQEQPQ